MQEKLITGAHVVEITDSGSWIRPGNLVFASGVAFHQPEEDLEELVRACGKAKAAGLVVEMGKYIFQVGEKTIGLAQKKGVVLLGISYEVIVSDVIAQIYYRIYSQKEKNVAMESTMRQILYGDPEKAKTRLMQFPFRQDRKHVALVAAISDCHGRDMTKEESQQLLQAAQLAFGGSGQEGLLSLAEEEGVILVPTLEREDNLHCFLEQARQKAQSYFSQYYPGAEVNFGVGTMFQEKEKMAKSIRQAKKAIRMVNSCHVAGGIRYYSELGIYRVFFSLPDDHVLRHLLKDILGPLISYDRKYHTELVDTLQYYLEEGQNITLTAERMYVHRNTIKYRMKRIEEILGYDMHDYNVLFHLRLCYKILHYLE